MAGKFELKKAKSKFMFNLKAGNGQTILTSETYLDKRAAQNGIASVRTNAPDDAGSNGKQGRTALPILC